AFLSQAPPMVPFRSMLLILRGGPESLAPRAYRKPIFPIALLHSFIALSRRTITSCSTSSVTRSLPHSRRCVLPSHFAAISRLYHRRRVSGVTRAAISLRRL